MLVAGKMQQTAARDGRKGPRRLVVGPGLELERADHVATGIGGQPFPHGLQQAVRVADHVREQPVHGSGMAGIKGETAADAVAHAGHVIHLRGEWGFVDAENLRAEAGEHPCPAAGGRTQIKAQIEETTSDFDREKLQERLAKLAGGVAVIRVGAATETEMKEAKLRMEDALNATRAAVEEGIISGGGSAYIHASKAVAEAIDGLEGDEKTGAKVVLKALEAPLFHISANAGLEGAVIINKVRESEVGTGFDALTEQYVDMVENGILDPAKVTRSALQNATSVASTLLTTESVVADIKEDAPAVPAGNPGMGMM